MILRAHRESLVCIAGRIDLRKYGDEAFKIEETSSDTLIVTEE